MAFDVYLVVVNFLLRMPGHGLRIAALRHLCAWKIGPASTIERGVRVTTKGGVTIGRGCIVHRNAVLDGRGGLTVGDAVDIASEVLCLTADHDPDSTAFKGRLRPVVIGSRSWIATRAILLPGALLHEGVVVGAGSTVTGEVASWTVVAGCPARKIRQRDPRAQRDLPSYRRWLH